jgi:transposase
VQRDPHVYGYEQARWRCCDLRDRLPWLADRSLSTISRILHRCGLRLKRGRVRVHSPDPAYLEKRDLIQWALTIARNAPEMVALYYVDEASLHRQPTLAHRWGEVGMEPIADLAASYDNRYRFCGALDATSGRVVWTAASTLRVSRICAFLRTLRAADLDRLIWLVWDNWPVHHHPKVVAEAERLGIYCLYLPTYAPWLNPIEKLWRLCRQTVVHHHRLANDWTALKAEMGALLDTFSGRSEHLLRYTGLSG